MESSTLRQRVHTSPSAKLAAQDKVTSTKGVKASSAMDIEKIILYGEFCQLTMDAVDLDQWSRYRGQMRYTEEELLDDSQPPHHLSEVSAFQQLPTKVCSSTQKDGHGQKDGYKAVKDGYLYAREDTQVAKAIKKKGRAITDPKGICIGYIAYSKADKDIVVAWRGTSQPYEWLQDAEVDQIKYKPAPCPPTTPGKTAPQPVPKQKNILPPSVAQPLLGLVNGVAAVAYGAIPALAVFVVGSLLLGLADGEELFAVLFTALYAAFASLPFYRKILKPLVPKIQDWLTIQPLTEANQSGSKQTKTTPNQNPLEKVWSALGGLGLPPAGNFAVLYALGVGLLSLSLNSLAVTAAPFPFTLLDGSYWGVNALLVGLSSMLWLGITAGMAAYAAAGQGVFVHEGFYEFYNNWAPEEDKSTRNAGEFRVVQPPSSCATLLEQVTSLVAQHERDHPGDRNLTITCTGHSLGGAMAVLSAFDIAESGYNAYSDGSRVNVRAVTFEAPRVGNPAFVRRFKGHEAYLKLVRIANVPDVVPDVPKAFFLQNIYFLICTLLNWQWGRDRINDIEKLEYKTRVPSAYEHPETEPQNEYLENLDSRKVEYFKRMGNPFDVSNNSARFSTYHNLELNLYLLSGLDAAGGEVPFTRDVALVNKTWDNLDPRLGIAPSWLQTLSPDVVKAPAVEKPYWPLRAAMIEPYSSLTGKNAKKYEEFRRTGTWNSDDAKDLVPLTRKLPDFDAGETKAQVEEEAQMKSAQPRKK